MIFHKVFSVECRILRGKSFHFNRNYSEIIIPSNNKQEKTPVSSSRISASAAIRRMFPNEQVPIDIFEETPIEIALKQRSDSDIWKELEKERDLQKIKVLTLHTKLGYTIFGILVWVGIFIILFLFYMTILGMYHIGQCPRLLL